MGKITSDSGRVYSYEGDYQSGYRAKDDNGNNSVYAFDEICQMKNHINRVEQGKELDAGNFGKSKKVVKSEFEDDDFYYSDFDDDDSQSDLEERFENGECGILSSLTLDGYEYYRG